MTIERYTLNELKDLIQDGEIYRLFKPFFYQGQILLNIEKILTLKDIYKLEDKIYGELQVVSTVSHDTDSKSRKLIITNSIKILKSSSLFNKDEIHHLNFKKRNECEKLLTGIIDGKPHLANQLIKLFKYSKKLFIHTINVGIISSVIDLGIQEKNKHHDGLQSEILLTAALLHDIGFLKFPKSMIEKKRFEYNEEEKKLYKTYPLESKKIALSMGDNIRQRTINIICQHQERLTGEGFPQELQKNDIDELALIVGLADDFDLMILNEISSSQKSSSDIMSKISRMGDIFGPHIVDSFYTCFRYLK